MKFVKKNLAAGNPVIWFPICKGDSHDAYGLGPFDHIEPIFGLYSNHELTDETIYDDDVIQHGSDWEVGPVHLGYFRPFNSLPDTKQMDGNCANAGYGPGRNEMYPCIYKELAYANAVTGIIDPKNIAKPLSL